MSDNLTVFGTNYTNVTGIKAKGTGNGTLTYIRPTGTKSISANGTGIDVAQYASVDVAVPAEDNTLVVALSYNESTQMWEPDKTFAEAYAAYQDGKDIIFVTTEYNEERPPVFGEYSTIFNTFHYKVVNSIVVDYDTFGNTTMELFWDAAHTYVGGSDDAWYTTDATAQPSQVAEGAVFYNANGKQVGTFNQVPTLQSKSVSYTPSETAQSATVTADSGYDGLSSVDVSVGAISSTYVGSGITRRSSTDLTASGATVTVPAGYYSAQASKAVASGSATVNSRITTTPSVSIDEDGLVTASLNGSVGAMPVVTEGYITAGTTGSISYSGSKTMQLDTQAAKTVTPSTSAQTAVAAGKYTTGAVTVAAMPSGTAGTPTATKGTVSNHSVSVTPSVTNTTGYITGGTKTGTAVTVSASELVSGSETKTANGTYNVTNLASLVVDIPFVTYHTSTSAPTSSQGSNGDLWLVTE